MKKYSTDISPSCFNCIYCVSTCEHDTCLSIKALALEKVRSIFQVKAIRLSKQGHKSIWVHVVEDSYGLGLNFHIRVIIPKVLLHR